MSKKRMDKLGNLPVIGPVFALLASIVGLVLMVVKREHLDES